MRLQRVEIRDLWSFRGDHPVVVEDFDDYLNVLIGPSGSGKSNLLRAILWIRDYHESFSEPETHFTPGERDLYNAGDPTIRRDPLLRATFRFADKDWHGAVGRLPSDDVLSSALSGQETNLKGEIVVGFETLQRNPLLCGPICIVQLERDQWFSDLCQRSGIDEKETRRDLGIAAIREITSRLVGIPGFRHLGDRVATAASYYELIESIKSPETMIQHYGDIYAKFCSLLCSIAGIPDFRLEVCRDKKDFYFTVGGRTIHASNRGDSMLHLLMLCIHLARHDGSVILIEEPETQMHPHLQRRMLRVLSEESSNQLVMTTHSSVMLDEGHIRRAYCLSYDGHCSRVHKVSTTDAIYAVLDELGARASDILQANVVIWVEGPSDRIFLKRCLELMNEDLQEGLHYQILYYGGSTRSHLTFEDKTDDLINVLKLSRNTVMICDSDRKSETDSINRTKERLREECKDAGAIYWITEGREIENYFSDDVLTRCYRRLLNNDEVTVRLGQFERLGEVLRDQVVPYVTDSDQGKIDYDSNKVRWMREITKELSTEDLDQLGLRKRLEHIERFIMEANS